MAISLLQTKNVAGASSSPATISMASTTNNSLIVVVTVYAAGSTGHFTSITGTGMNFRQILDIAGTSQNLTFWYSFNNVAASTPAITLNYDAGSAISAIAREYSGLAFATDPLDRTKSSTGTSVNATSTNSFDVVKNTDLVIGAFTDSWGSGQTYTVGAGYSNLTSVINNSSWNVSLEDKIITSAGPQIATLTLGNSTSWIGAVISFKVPGAKLPSNNLRPHPFSPGLAR